MADAPRVFLSYSHDSDEHADRVLALADALCDRGIDVILDRYVHPAPAEGWPRWMDRNLDQAQFVLMELENFLDFLLVFRLSEVSGSSFRRTWVTCECFAVPASARPACLAPLAVV